MKKLILGTAQFGLKYGITNPKLSIPKEKVFEILQKATTSQIEYFDTAFAYGNSIEIIGECFRELKIAPSVINKIQSFDSRESEEKAYDSVTQSLGVLGISRYYALLLHDPNALKDRRVWDFLKKLKQEGKVEKIGASIYAPQDLQSCSYAQEIEILQFPINILSDQKTCLESFKSSFPRGLPEIHARSIYLQGLLLRKASTWPKMVADCDSFLKIEEYLAILCKEIPCDLIELCTRYVKSLDWIQGVVFGVYDLIQLNEVLEVFDKKYFEQKVINSIDINKPYIPPNILDPRVWVSPT